MSGEPFRPPKDDDDFGIDDMDNLLEDTAAIAKMLEDGSILRLSDRNLINVTARMVENIRVIDSTARQIGLMDEFPSHETVDLLDKAVENEDAIFIRLVFSGIL